MSIFQLASTCSNTAEDQWQTIYRKIQIKLSKEGRTYCLTKKKKYTLPERKKNGEYNLTQQGKVYTNNK